MTREEAIRILDEVIPPPEHHTVDLDHLRIAQAWLCIKETLKTEPKRDLEVVVNEACLNCELDCVEVVRCHKCKNYKEAKNGCNGFCKEWNTSTYTWEWCSRRAKMGEVEE